MLRCGECGCEFEYWEEIYSWDGGGGPGYVCEDCFDALFSELTRRERVELMGSEVTTREELGMKRTRREGGSR